MLDLRLLQVMKYKKEFKSLYGTIPESFLDLETKTLIEDFKRYFDAFPTHDAIDMVLFVPQFERWHGTWTPEKLAAMKGVLKLVTHDVDEDTKGALAASLYEFNLATSVFNKVKDFEEGMLDYPLAQVISADIDKYKMQIGAKAAQWNNTNIGDLLQEDLDNSGVLFRLNALNKCMRPLRPGDFGIVAGRPDKGKTTFLSSEITFMARQLPEDRNVLWLNNEGLSGRIRKRIFQSALGVPITELIQLNKQGILEDMYAEAVGRIDKIRVFDVHDFHVGQVELLLEQHNPGIIVYDMIDNIRGFGSESRTDLQLERMYQWARERSVKYSCIGLATSQISADGEDVMYPTLGMLKDSKTGKQGACDFQIMIGTSPAAILQNSRFISVPKNKLRREGSPGDPRCEVLFDTDSARYLDIN